MTTPINTNINAQSTQRSANQANKALQGVFARISSGLEVKKASDNAAALAISIDLTSQIQGLNQSQRNANDAISVTQVASGALDEVSNILQRSRELSLQAANGTNSTEARGAIQSELNQLQDQLQQITSSTDFNGQKLFEGDLSIDFQIGTNNTDAVTVQIDDPLTDLDQLDVSSQTSAQATISNIDSALEKVSTTQAELGAVQNRFSSAVRSLSSTEEGLVGARSRITDADIAKESANLVKNFILSQASLATQAQANVSQKNALALIQ